MTRKIVWSLVAVAVLATLVSLWFLQNFEQVMVPMREGPQKEALRNPYLVLERLFSELGRPIKRVQSPRLLDALPANGVLILDSNRRRHETRADFVPDIAQAMRSRQGGWRGRRRRRRI